MKQTPDNAYTIIECKETIETKHKYQSPRLVEYGHIVKLTQAATGSQGDGGSGGMQPM